MVCSFRISILVMATLSSLVHTSNVVLWLAMDINLWPWTIYSFLAILVLAQLLYFNITNHTTTVRKRSSRAFIFISYADTIFLLIVLIYLIFVVQDVLRVHNNDETLSLMDYYTADNNEKLMEKMRANKVHPAVWVMWTVVLVYTFVQYYVLTKYYATLKQEEEESNKSQNRIKRVQPV